MEALLKASEASALMGVSMRHVRRMAQSGALSYQIHMNAQNRPEYLFPLSSLPDAAQQKYFAEHAPAALGHALGHLGEDHGLAAAGGHDHERAAAPLPPLAEDRVDRLGLVGAQLHGH